MLGLARSIEVLRNSKFDISPKNFSFIPSISNDLLAIVDINIFVFRVRFNKVPTQKNHCLLKSICSLLLIN